MKIAIFVGSLREQSFNKSLAREIERQLPDNTEVVYANLNLPLYSEDLEADYPKEARDLKDMIESADGVLFVTPEYNRSIPGVLKNAIDWASRPYGTNSFKGKPMGVIGASLNIAGTAAVQVHMRAIAAFLEMKQLGQPEIIMPVQPSTFDDQGVLIDERWQKNVATYAQVFARWVESQK